MYRGKKQIGAGILKLSTIFFLLGFIIWLVHTLIQPITNYFTYMMVFWGLGVILLIIDYVVY